MLIQLVANDQAIFVESSAIVALTPTDNGALLTLANGHSLATAMSVDQVIAALDVTRQPQHCGSPGCPRSRITFNADRHAEQTL